MGSFVFFASKVIVIKMSKMDGVLFFFLTMAAQNSHDLGKCIWNILLSSFKKHIL